MSVRHRVGEGALLLDQMYPGWWEAIDTNTLNMAEYDFCVIGQVMAKEVSGVGPYPRDTFVGRVRKLLAHPDLGVGDPDELVDFDVEEWATRLGFDAVTTVDDNREYHDLREEWIAEIVSRGGAYVGKSA